jgi:hypothetical protein
VAGVRGGCWVRAEGGRCSGHMCEGQPRTARERVGSRVGHPPRRIPQGAAAGCAAASKCSLRPAPQCWGLRRAPAREVAANATDELGTMAPDAKLGAS